MLTFWFLPHLLLVCGLALAIPLIAQMIRQRRSPAGSMAWLLAMLLVPYVGIPLYLTFGGRKMRRLAASKEDLRFTHSLPPMPAPVQEIDRLLHSYQLPGPKGETSLKLCLTGEEAYRNLVELIEQAHFSIHISTFILASDAVGRDIIARLTRKAEDGLQVRVLLDGVGCLHVDKSILKPLRQAGGQIAYFMPVLHRPFRGRTNLRNHRKAVIVDGTQAWSGGSNIAEEYLGPTPLPGRWRDLSYLIEGPVVQDLVNIFTSDWQFATGQNQEQGAADGQNLHHGAGASIVQVVPSGPDVDRDPLYAVILSAIFQARQRLWVVTPYFIPDESLAQALQLAAQRGIDVRLILPQRSNHWLADQARGTYMRDLQDAGAKILLLPDEMLHAKALLVDHSLVLVGSANLDMRSLFLNYETGLLLYSDKEIYAIEKWMTRLLKDCTPGVNKVGNWQDLQEGVARLLAPLL